MEKPWSGRFSEDSDSFLEEFTESVSFDRILALEDIFQSKAHARALHRAGILTDEELRSIIKGLDSIEKDIKEGRFQFKRELEDVHMNIEAELTARIGDAGRKIHTGRSRNDQVATDERLYIKKEIRSVASLLRQLRVSLIKRAEEHIDTIMPSYTHLQRAQPIRASHYFLAFREMFLKDAERLWDLFRRVDESPLGSGSVAGVDFDIDRFYTAGILGFSKVSRNSISATSDRDFILEFLFVLAQVGLHLSRLAEDLIIYSTEEFSFVKLPDRLCTGSSIMPQKKNPDILELIRAKSGRLIGNLVSLMTVVKGLPSAYNRDLQEDKEPLFDSVKTAKDSIKGMIRVIEGLEIDKERTALAGGGFALMTDVANYLVRKGVPFRDSHKIAGKITAYLLEEGKMPEEVTVEELKKFSEKFEGDVLEILNASKSSESRKTYGGTSREEILRRIEVAKREEGMS